MIPKKLSLAFAAGYRKFSWVQSISLTASTPLDLFAKGQANYQGHRFYWQTPQGDLFLVGVGESQLTNLNLANQETCEIYTNATTTGTGPLLLGGLAFNHRHPAPELWGELDQGAFYLPKFLVSVTDEGTFLSSNFQADSLDELTNTWLNLKTEFLTWQETPLPEFEIRQDLAEKKVELSTTELNLAAWLNVVDQAVETLKSSSQLEKVVLARQLKVSNTHPWDIPRILKNLQTQQLATYIFAFEAGEHIFIGASPERLLKATEQDYSTACIAGSIPRGKTAAEDTLLGETLLKDLKNQKEHQIVVNQIAADLQSMIQDKLTILAPTLLKNLDIQHLHVPLQGKRDPQTDFLTGVRKLHPTPALGGQPKNLALAFIAEHEPIGRGMYGAPIGWFSLQNDSGEFAVGIRSGIFSQREAYLYAGCGIVADSVAELERQETNVKFQPMLRAIGGIQDDFSKTND